MKKKPKYKIFLLIFCSVIILIILFFLFFKFSNINIEPKKFESVLGYYFSNQSLWTIFNNSRFIMNNYPEIIKINIKPNFLNLSISVKINETTYVAKICDQKECFYLDTFSRIIKPKLTVPEKMPLIEAHIQITNNSLLHPLLQNTLATIFEYANWKPMIIRKIIIYSNLDIGIIDSSNKEFIFDPYKDIEQQIKKMEIFNNKKIQGKRIDLRINKKIYFY